MMCLTDQGMMLKSLLLVSLCVGAATMFDNKQLDDHWDQWKRTYGKTYKDEVEENHRRELWEKNLMLITKHNLEASMGLHTYELGMNFMGDMAPEEIQQFSGKLIPPIDLKREPLTFQGNDIPDTVDLRKLGCVKSVKDQTPGKLIPPADLKRAPLPFLNTDVPDSCDWRDKCCVTSVKNEGSCISSYAFTAAGALECQLAKKSKRLIELSSQQLVDCSGESWNDGCVNGTFEAAFNYITKYGIMSEASYPYQGRLGRCNYDDKKIVTKCNNFECLPRKDEEGLKKAVFNIGPIAVMIETNHDEFRYYKSGIYDNPKCTDQMNRGALIVGYGTQDGKDYWLVKNSWGTGWGEEGYIRMVRNKNSQCGIARSACYPIMEEQKKPN